MQQKKSFFQKFSNKTAKYSGKPITFLMAVLIVVVWGVTGPLFKYSDTWQLVINTGTTIITFLMVFLIQNTQNRDTKALQLKLDEIIIALSHAHNEMVELEDLDEAELEKVHDRMKKVAKESEESLEDSGLIEDSDEESDEKE